MIWLNEHTKEWLYVVNGIENGKFVTVWKIRQEFKISKYIEWKLQELINKQL